MGQRHGIGETLQSFQRVGLDTPIFIYHIEQPPRWGDIASSILRAMADGHFTGFTSVLTLLELTTKPLQLGRPEVADVYEGLLQDIPNLTILNLDAGVARIGAELRAAYGLRTPDSLQIAACISHGVDVFVTNDRRLRRVKEPPVLLLDDFA